MYWFIVFSVLGLKGLRGSVFRSRGSRLSEVVPLFVARRSDTNPRLLHGP